MSAGVVVGLAADPVGIDDVTEARPLLERPHQAALDDHGLWQRVIHGMHTGDWGCPIRWARR